jgi:hypothetical protein
MSKVMRSGRSMVRTTPFHVWNSTTFICAADSRPCGSAILTIGG